MLPYVVERRSQPKGKRQVKGQGFCPFLRWLSLEEGITPLVWCIIAEYGTFSTSFESARTTLAKWGISLSLKRIERLTYHFGKRGLSLRQSKLFQLKQGTLPIGSVLKDQRVIISADGGRTRIRLNKRGKRNPKTHRRGYIGEWQEPKLLTIYTVNKQGKKVSTSELPVTNDGSYEGYKAFLELLEMHLVTLGINQAKQVLLVADGAEWIWKHIPPLLQRLGRHAESTYQLPDFYHTTEHLQVFADAAFIQPDERKTWFKQARSDLKRGKVRDILD